MTLETLLTAEELAERPDDDLRSELVRGELVEMPPPARPHGRAASRISGRLLAFAEPRGLGEVHVETGFVLRRDPDTVRSPDVSFVSASRLATQPDAGYFEGPPDLAVEIQSPSDAKRALAEKVADYLEAGTALVWAVDPIERCVIVHRPDGAAVACRDGDRLEGGAVLPGFSVRVEELFG